jgi:4-hydroxybenzoate polyprenyltransferase
MPLLSREAVAETRPATGRSPRPSLLPILRLLRPHQWLKNILIFVPALLAHEWKNYATVRNTILAAACFCAAASAVYVINDLLDIEADRNHARKRLRPLAAGTVTKPAAMLIAAILLLAAGGLALRLPQAFGLTLLIYFAVSTLYSLYLKTKVILDICILAGLYTIRLFAGGTATHIPISEWTMAFAMFCFLGLAAVKRYTELQTLPDAPSQLQRRGYERGDQTTVQALGMSSMMISVLVLALYLHSPEVMMLYRRPEMLWLICPVMLYWFGRVWIVAGRGRMHSDPIIFAIRDRASLLAAALIVVIGLLCK